MKYQVYGLTGVNTEFWHLNFKAMVTINIYQDNNLKETFKDQEGDFCAFKTWNIKPTENETTK